MFVRKYGKSLISDGDSSNYKGKGNEIQLSLPAMGLQSIRLESFFGFLLANNYAVLIQVALIYDVLNII